MTLCQANKAIVDGLSCLVDLTLTPLKYIKHSTLWYLGAGPLPIINPL